MPTIQANAQVDERSFQDIFYADLGIEDFVKVDHGTDGYMYGTIFEHKKNATSYGRSKALSQALIYLTRFNREGMEIPRNIAIVSQEENRVFFYDASDYMDIINDIPAYANMQPSRGIDDFVERKTPVTLDFRLHNARINQPLLSKLTTNQSCVKIDITEHNVYGWASRFYKEHPKKHKRDMFAELENPNCYADYINPWRGKPEDFSLIMDLLNDPQQQKKAGAFYTPPEYAAKAVELVRNAIMEVPDGKDYIIIDRCAGTGSLELNLTDDELKHVIISTYELKEWHALKDRFENRVLYVKPPVPAAPNTYPDSDKDGFLVGANAMTEEFLTDSSIMKYVNDKDHYTIILLENPPYTDDSGSTTQTGKSRGNSADNRFMVDRFNKDVGRTVSGMVSSKDTANLFIWSGFKYYLRDKHDAYILFSPIKYWKTAHLVNKEFREGYLLNRLYFHANASAISLIRWNYTDSEEPVETLSLQPLDIENGTIVPAYELDTNGNKQDVQPIIIRKVYKPVNQYFFDKRVFSDDTENGIWCQRNGFEGQKYSSTATSNIYNCNIIGYLHLIGFAFDSKNITLVRNTLNLRKNGFYLRTDVNPATGYSYYLEALPLFCAKAYPQNKWYYTNIFSTCADCCDKPPLPKNDGTVPPRSADYQRDITLLKRALIFTCLTNKNKCRSFVGSDGRHYQNELCFETDTVASKDLQRLCALPGNELTDEENSLIAKYHQILDYIKRECVPEKHPGLQGGFYDKDYTYGPFQIKDELDVDDATGVDRRGKPIKQPRDGNLRRMLASLQQDVNRYYRNNLACDDHGLLFDYSLLK